MSSYIWSSITADTLSDKDDLMRAVWPDSFVNEINIPRTVHTIRGTLGEDDNGNKFIETVPTKGYRFVAEVEEVNGYRQDRYRQKQFLIRPEYNSKDRIPRA